MSYQTLIYTLKQQVANITLNRSELRNAFNEQMIAELTQVFTEVDQDTHVRVAVLAANGPAFCAGADLNWMKKMANYSDAENEADAYALASMLNTIYRCSKPVIAQVQGDCYAGGTGLVAAADIAIAAEGVHFCLSETRLGLIPATIAPYVIQAMGARAARRYFLTAERFSASQAEDIGFIHQSVPTEQLENTVQELVQTLLKNGPQALTASKRLIDEVAHQTINDELLQDTAKRIAHIRSSNEGREGVRAFLEKRKPSWV